jgi:hypothetical protein
MDWQLLAGSNFKIVLIVVDGRDMQAPVVGASGRVSHLFDKLVAHGVRTDSIYFIVTNDSGARKMTSSEFASSALLHQLGPIQLSMLQEFINAARFISWGDQGPANHQLQNLRTLFHRTAHAQVAIESDRVCMRSFMLLLSCSCLTHTPHASTPYTTHHTPHTTHHTPHTTGGPRDE